MNRVNKQSNGGFTAFLVLIFILLGTVSVTAQDVASALDTKQVTTVPNKSLIDMYKTGGWAMYPLTFFSIAGFGLIIYNFMAVQPKVMLNTKELI